MEITDMQITDLYAGCLDGSMDGIWHVKRLPCLSVVQALEGRYDVQLGGGAVLALEEGDVFVTMPAVEQRLWHHDSRETGRMRAHWMFFNVRCAGGGYLTDLYEFPARLPVGCSARVRELIGGVLREGPCLRYARAFEMTDILLQNAVRRDGAGGVYLRVKDYILENLGNNEALSGKRLAAYAHASRSSFYRNFKDLFGMTASAYIR